MFFIALDDVSKNRYTSVWIVPYSTFFMSSPPPSGIGAKFLLVSASVVVIFAGIKAAQSLLAPFFLAVFLALILTPPLQWLKKKGLSDGIAILALSTFLFLLGLGLVFIFTNSLTHFASKLPVYRDKVSITYTTIDTWINHAADRFNAFGESIKQLNPIEFGTSEAEPIGDVEDEESPHPNPLPEGEGTLVVPAPEEREGTLVVPVPEEGKGTLVVPVPEEGEGTLVVPAPEERKGTLILPLPKSGERLFAVPEPEEWLAEGQTSLTPQTNEPVTLSAPTASDHTTSDQSPVRERLSLSNYIPVNTLISYVQLGVNMLLNIATVSSLVIIMVVFMLIEAARMPEKAKEAFGGRDLSGEYFKKIADDTWNYMKIKTIVCFLTGLSASIGLWFLDVDYPILWGLLLFFLNYIPNIGQVIASVPPILLALIDGGLLSATLVTAWLIFVNSLFGIGVEPRYLGHGLDISSLVVLLSLIFWGWLLGPIGMFLSAPLTMVVKIILQNDPKTRWLAVLLSNR